MRLFKKKPKVFGESIEPDCSYCKYNEGEASEANVVCPYKLESPQTCKRYEYDPTLRIPKGSPKLKKFTEDDFSI